MVILHRWETRTRNPQSFGPGYSFGFPHIRQPRALFTHSFILATLTSFLRVPTSARPLLMFRAIPCFLQTVFGSSGLLFQTALPWPPRSWPSPPPLGLAFWGVPSGSASIKADETRCGDLAPNNTFHGMWFLKRSPRSRSTT